MRLSEVTKRYGRGAPVLHGVDLTVEPGEVVIVDGANGSGKSTLTRLVTGLARPTSGSVTGRPRVVGYVPERFPPDERLSAAQYLAHLGRVRGLSTADARQRAAALLDRLALAGGPDTPLRQLSKGNAQKVAVAQALLVTPGLLVLDEPFSGLDPSAHDTLTELVDETAARGTSVLLTHHGEVSTRGRTPYGLREGSLQVREPRSRAVTELVLSPPTPDAKLPVSESVLDIDDGGRGVSVLVDDEDRDAVLLEALRAGWSTVALRRDVR